MSKEYLKSLTIGGTTIRGLPPVSTEDNEKVLGVVDGRWEVVDAETFEVTEKSWTRSLDFGDGNKWYPLSIVGAEDDDKVLTVVDGEWQAEKIPSKPFKQLIMY